PQLEAASSSLLPTVGDRAGARDAGRWSRWRQRRVTFPCPPVARPGGDFLPRGASMIETPIRVSVFKPASRAVYVAQWVDPESGRKKTKSTKTPVQRDAMRFGVKLEKALNNGADVFGRRTS